MLLIDFYYAVQRKLKIHLIVRHSEENLPNLTCLVYESQLVDTLTAGNVAFSFFSIIQICLSFILSFNLQPFKNCVCKACGQRVNSYPV